VEGSAGRQHRLLVMLCACRLVMRGVPSHGWGSCWCSCCWCTMLCAWKAEHLLCWARVLGVTNWVGPIRGLGCRVCVCKALSPNPFLRPCGALGRIQYSSSKASGGGQCCCSRISECMCGGLKLVAVFDQSMNKPTGDETACELVGWLLLWGGTASVCGGRLCGIAEIDFLLA
jgi:hypothetical protein